MQLIVDISLLLIMFVFAYAFGRRSESDDKPVIPPTVTWFSLFILIGIMVLLNLPAIIEMMSSYKK